MILVGALYLLLLFRYVRLSGHPTNLWHTHIFNTQQQHYHNNNSTVREPVMGIMRWDYLSPSVSCIILLITNANTYAATLAINYWFPPKLVKHAKHVCYNSPTQMDYVWANGRGVLQCVCNVTPLPVAYSCTELINNYVLLL